MTRSTTWWLVTGVCVALAATGCTSGSGGGKSTSLASAAAAGDTAAVSAVSGSAAGSAVVGADVFSCPSAAEINSLTAKAFTASVGNGVDHCEYVVTTGSTQAVRVTIDHPPASATSTYETLAQFRAAVVAAGNVVLTTAPQYSPESFIARYGDLSCSVFALARDGQAMQVQASHRTPVPVDDCALAQSVTAVAGTAGRPASAAPDSGSSVSSVASPSGVAPTTSVPPAPSTPVAPPAPSATPTPRTTAPTTTRPSTPSSTSEVLIFSTGPVPAASFTLPAPRPTLRTTATSR